MAQMRSTVLVCAGSACISAGCKKIYDALTASLQKHNARDVNIVETGCVGMCDLGPIIIIYPEGTFYSNLKPENVDEIVSEHIVKGRICSKYIYTVETKKYEALENLPFYKKQVRIALRNVGLIDPLKIEEYIARGGYEALYKALNTPAKKIVKEITDSGLRGRGGGGFPTGIKWGLMAKEKSKEKYVVCNADEGDPGAFMDRSILEGDPHSVIEAMAIAGCAVGASYGFVYVRAEYPLAIERLKAAIEQAYKFELLGKNIFNSKFSFDIEIRMGAGAFVCGEETALIASIEGKRGQPVSKPPYPSQSGLWGKPTLINNVETFANIPEIIIKGAKWFKGFGTKTSAGTKVFALAGDIKNTGLVEVPMGISLRELVYDIGGGYDEKIKAVQIGGPSGGCIPEKMFDIPVDYDSLSSVGAMMGSGGLIVISEKKCMVDMAKFFLEFSCEESCGKCPPCRIGNTRMHEILQRITEGKAEEDDLEKLQKLARRIKIASLCGLGQSSPNPVLSTLRYFKDEYIEHIKDKKCAAGVCAKLLRYEIIPEKCIGCTICAKACPVKAIDGEPKKPHFINQDICIKCGICYEKCPVSAIHT